MDLVVTPWMGSDRLRRFLWSNETYEIWCGYKNGLWARTYVHTYTETEFNYYIVNFIVLIYT